LRERHLGVESIGVRPPGNDSARSAFHDAAHHRVAEILSQAHHDAERTVKGPADSASRGAMIATRLDRMSWSGLSDSGHQRLVGSAVGVEAKVVPAVSSHEVGHLAPDLLTRLTVDQKASDEAGDLHHCILAHAEPGDLLDA